MTTSRLGQVLAREFEMQAAERETDLAIELATETQGERGAFTTMFRLRKAVILD